MAKTHTMLSALAISVLLLLVSGASAFLHTPTVFTRSATSAPLAPLRSRFSVAVTAFERQSRACRAAPIKASANEDAGNNEKLVGLIGAAGGVGRLTAAALLEQGFKVRAIVRNKDRAAPLLPSDMDIVEADVSRPEYGVGLAAAIAGVDSLVVCSGTTAFPSDKWGKNGENGPKQVDEQGVINVATAVEAVNGGSGPRVSRVSLLSSIGVQRRGAFPFVILNAFGVLDAKANGEAALKQAAERSGFKFAVVRPGRLTGEPFTNPDFATLLKIEEGSKQGASFAKGDPDGFAGDASRRQTALVLAQTVVQDEATDNLDFSFINKEGPPLAQDDWDEAFAALSRPAEALRLEFDSLDEERFGRWLVSWGNGILSSGALFPPLPLPVRVDYPDNDTEIGLQLNFVSVTVTGEVTPVGRVVLRLVEGRKGPALVGKREPATQDSPFPGETQILEKLQEDLQLVVSNEATWPRS